MEIVDFYMENQEINNKNTPEPMNDGEMMVRDPQTGKFAPGHPFVGGSKKGWKSPKKRLAEMWKEVPLNQKMERGEALLLKMWNMAIVEGNEAIIRIMFGYLEGLPRQPIDFKELEPEQVPKEKDEKLKAGLEKVFQALENLKKPHKTFKYEETVVEVEKQVPDKPIVKEKKKEQPKDPRIGTFYIPPDPE
jgi:hypothetical protein